MTTSEWFSAVLERPVLYIGSSSIREIDAFMQGIFYGSQNEPDALYSGFSEWIRDRFDCDLAVGWSHVVMLEANEEDERIKLTRELWLEYKDEQN